MPDSPAQQARFFSVSSPHLLYRRGAQLRASDRTRHTPRSRPSAATPGRLDASSRFLSLRSQLNERTTSVKGCEQRTQSAHCGVGHVYEFVETVAASTCTFLSCRCCGSAVCWSSYSHCLMPRRMPWRPHRARFRVRGGCPHRARLRRPHRARFRVCLLTLTY